VPILKNLQKEKTITQKEDELKGNGGERRHYTRRERRRGDADEANAGGIVAQVL